MDTDSVLERIRLKSQLAGWRALSVILICSLLILLVGGGNLGGLRAKKNDRIARVSIEGIIEDDPERIEKLGEIAEDDSIKAVILRLNTPGGTVVGGESLYLTIKKIREKKPVVAVMSDMATSAGYLIAVGSDHIIARNGTLTGSIGVLLQSAEVTELAQKLGIGIISIKSAPLKGTPSPFEKMTPEATAAAQSLIDSFYKIFVDIVSRERKLPLEQVLTIADGRVFTGTQAYDVRLVDAIGGEDEALEWLHNVKKIDEKLRIKDVELYPEPSKIEEFLHNLGIDGANSRFERFSLQGLVSIW